MIFNFYRVKMKEKQSKKVEETLKKIETEDVKNMSREIEEIAEKEIRESTEKKESLKAMFLDAIEEKKRQESIVKQEEEFREKSLKIYRDIKTKMEKIAIQKAKAAKEKKIHKEELMGNVTRKKKNK